MKRPALLGRTSTLILLVTVALPATTDIAKWRADYESSLKAPDGWLSVAGLVWLHEGSNNVGPAIFNLHGNKVTYQGRPLQSDISEHPDVVKVGNISITVVDRGRGLARACAIQTLRLAASLPAATGFAPAPPGTSKPGGWRISRRRRLRLRISSE